MTYAPPLLGYLNRADAATLGGGSYTSSRPITNMQSLKLFKVARTADDSSSSTYVVADLGAAYAIRIIAITNHNFSAAATIRVRAAATEGGLTSAPSVDVSQNVWLGSNTPANTAMHMPCALVILAADATYRWWRVDIGDSSNADGYIEFGYLQIWQCLEFGEGVNLGLTQAPETGTIKQETIGLVGNFDRRRSRRVETFVTDNLDAPTADLVLDIVRDRDLDQPIFWLPDPSPTDLGRILRRSFLARLRSLTALEHPYWDRERGAWSVEEIVGG